MANYQSIPARFNKTKSRINHQYIDSVLKDKQNTIDTNFGIIQKSVEKVLGQDFANPEDAEMLKNKVSSILNALGKTDSIKFDSKKSRFFIQDALSQAAKDPEVLKEVANTKRIQEFQKQIQEAQKKGTFNINNFQVAKMQANLDAYMKTGAERDKNLGSLTYTPYYDANKELMEVTKNIADLYEEKERVIEKDGKYITVSTDNLEPEETREKIWAQLSPQAKQQMAIDGYAGLGFNTKEFDSTLDLKIENLKKRKKEKIQALNDTVDILSSEGERQEIQERASALELVYDSNIEEAVLLRGIKSPLNKGLHYQKNKILNTLITDDYRPDIVVGVKETKEYKRNEKIKRETEKIQNNLSYADGAVQVAGELPLELQGSKSAEPVIDQQYNEIQKRKQDFNSLAGEYFDKYTPEQKKVIQSKRDKVVEAYREKGMTPTDYEVNKKLIKDYGADIIQKETNLKEKQKLRNSFAELNKLADREEELSISYLEDYNEDVKLFQESKIEDFYKNITTSSDLKTINENNKIVNVKDELAGLGVSSAEDLLKIIKGDFFVIPNYNSLTSQEQAEFRKKAGYLNANIIFGAAVNSLSADIQHTLVRLEQGQPKNIEKYFGVDQIKAIKESLGLEGSINEYIEIFEDNEVTGGLGGVFGTVKVEKIRYKPNTELFKFIKQASSREGAHTTNKTFEDVGGSIQAFNLSGDKFRKFRLSQDDSEKINMTTDNMISIKPSKGSGEKGSVKVWEDLKGQSGRDNKGNITQAVPDNFDGTVFLAKNPKNPEELFVILNREIKPGSAERGYKKETKFEKYSTIKANQITDVSFNNLVDAIEQRDRLDFLGKTDNISSKPSYILNNGPEQKQIYRDLRDTFGAKKAEELTYLQTKEKISPYLASVLEKTKSINSSNSERLSQAKNLALYFEKNYHKYRLNLKGSNGDYYLALVEKDSPKEIITQIPVEEDSSMKQLEEIYYKYPAAYITQLMGDAVAKQGEGISQTTKNYFKKIK